jgi:hypothetical protein
LSARSGELPLFLSVMGLLFGVWALMLLGFGTGFEAERLLAAAHDLGHAPLTALASPARL